MQSANVGIAIVIRWLNCGLKITFKMFNAAQTQCHQIDFQWKHVWWYKWYIPTILIHFSFFSLLLHFIPNRWGGNDTMCHTRLFRFHRPKKQRRFLTHLSLWMWAHTQQRRFWMFIIQLFRSLFITLIVCEVVNLSIEKHFGNQLVIPLARICKSPMTKNKNNNDNITTQSTQCNCLSTI